MDQVMYTWIIQTSYKIIFLTTIILHILIDKILWWCWVLTHCISGNSQRVMQPPLHMWTHLQSSKIQNSRTPCGDVTCTLWNPDVYRGRLRSLTGKLGRHHDIFFSVRRGVPTVLIGHVVEQESRGVPCSGIAPFGLKSLQISIGMLTV